MDNQPNTLAVIGMFDGVHSGHRNLLAQARELAAAEGLQPIAVTFRRHPLSVIAPNRVPGRLCSGSERGIRLRMAGATDVVMLDFTPELRLMRAADFVAMLKRDHGVRSVLLGFNQTIGCDRVCSPEAFAEITRDTGVVISQAHEAQTVRGRTISSSAIRAALSQGQVELARDMLGRPYTIEGRIEHGRHLGRTIGFPTANLHMTERGILVPMPGVYATVALLPDGSELPAVTNIGIRPTVDDSEHPVTTIETHIPGFDGDLYGQSLRLQFRRYLRPERHFNSLDDLRTQLTRDVADAAG